MTRKRKRGANDKKISLLICVLIRKALVAFKQFPVRYFSSLTPYVHDFHCLFFFCYLTCATFPSLHLLIPLSFFCADLMNIEMFMQERE